MHNDALYGGWELSRPELTGRSHLYSLPPIGIGTDAVESLTGYISRLAAAHAVETGALINRELLPRIRCTRGPRAGQSPASPSGSYFYLDAHALNGPGDRTRLWVAILEQLTKVEQLDFLTFLPWAKAISCVHLLRSCRAWCSSCYEVRRSSAQPVYESLLWALQLVAVCPVHRQPLDTVCYSCARTQYVFSPKTRPGFCSRCQCWLGRELGGSRTDADLADQIRVAEMVGELVAASPTLRTNFELEVFRQNIRHFVRDAGGSLPFRERIQHRHIRGWVRRTNIPRIDSLVDLSRSQNASVIRLLTEEIDNGYNTAQKRISQTQLRVAASIEEALQTALRAGTPPPLREIASQLGYRTVAPLQSRYPQLCSEVASKRRTWLKASGPRPLTAAVPRDNIVKALTDELSNPSITNLRVVAASVGLSSTRRLYKDFRDLRLAIVAKNSGLRNGPGNPPDESALRVLIDDALRTAFNERPFPTVTEVAHRLGFPDARPVSSRFPELTAELRSCRRGASRTEYGHRVSERVRKRLTDALVESPPPSCAEIARRVAGHKSQMRQDFPDLWNALRTRYADHKREVHRLKRQTFADEVFRTVVELNRKGVYPTVSLVLANIPAPSFRTEVIVAEAVRVARRELSIQPYGVYRGRA